MIEQAISIAQDNADTARKALEQRDELAKAAKPFRDGFTYDPGHSDLDNEQPIHVRVTLGEWRRLHYVLRKLPID